MSIEPVQRVEVRVLVDNTTDGLSSNPDFVETELTSLRNRRQGAWMMNGGSLSSPAHGLSCLVTIRYAGQSRGDVDHRVAKVVVRELVTSEPRIRRRQRVRSMQ